MKCRTKRIYDTVEKADGLRVLVDRLWPRGVTKEEAQLDLWAKELAPSSRLRMWFHKDRKERIKEFEKRYSSELAENTEALAFKHSLKKQKTVTLLSAVKDITHSHLPPLSRFLTSR